MNENAYINFIGGINVRAINVLANKIQELIDKGINRIDIGIISGGGDSDYGINAYYYIKKFLDKVEINTINLSKCYSSAIPLYLVGKKKYAFKNSEFIIHDGKIFLQGDYNKSQLESEIKRLDCINDMYIDIVSKYINLSSKDYYSQTVIKTKDKLDNFIDEVINDFPSNYKYSYRITSHNINEITIDLC